MNDSRQMQALLGMSSNMEKSLANIEASLTATTSTAGKTSSALGGLASSVAALSNAVSGKKFNKANANNIIQFSQKLVEISNKVDVSKAKNFTDFAQGMGIAFDTLLKVFEPKNMIKLIIGAKVGIPVMTKLIQGISAMFKNFNSKDVKKAGEGIQSLGEGIKALSSGMATLALIGIAAPLIAAGALVARLVAGLFVNLGKSSKSLKEGGDALKHLGKGLIAFSAGLATLMLVILIVSPSKILAGIAIIASFAVTFALLGQVERYIHGGAESIAEMGLAIFYFSVALATFMLVIMIAKPKLILEGIGILVALAGTFAILGKFDKQIMKGALAIKKMGRGLLFVSVGLAAFALAMKLVDAKTATLGPLVLIGLGASFAAIGFLNKAGFVDSGANAMRSVGISLLLVSAGILVFGLALKALGEVFKGDLVMAAVAGAGVLLGLGLAFAGIGFMAGLIAPGAAAMITVGFALMAISGGILIFGLALKGLQKIFPGEEGLKQAGYTAGGILLGLGVTFMGLGLMSLLIIPGAAAGVIMGLSLLSISLGMWTFGNTLDGLYKKNLMTKEGKLKGIGIISDMMSEFAGMFFTSIFAIPGIVAAVGMGNSLMVISKGLKDVGEVIGKVNPKFVEKLFGDDGLISGLAKGFKKVGEDYSGGFLASFMGTDPLSLGIRTARGMGNALQEIAGGIASFANFNEFPVKIPDPKNPSNLIYKAVDIFGDVMPKINENLPKLLSALSIPFAAIGMAFGGSFFSDGPVEKGAEAVKEIGGALSSLVGGIVGFANFEQFPVQIVDPTDPSKLSYKAVNIFGDIIPKIEKNIPAILGALAPAFAAVANAFPDGFFSDSAVKEGAETVKSAGEGLASLVGGIVGFANFNEFPVQIAGPDGKLIYKNVNLFSEMGKIQKAMPMILTGIANIFSNVDSIVVDTEKLDSLERLGKIFEKFGKAGEGMEKFAGSFGTFSSNMKVFSDSFNFTGEKERAFGKFSTQLLRHAGAANNYVKFANSFKSISKDMKSFADNFKIMNDKAISAFKIWTDSLIDFAKIDPAKFSVNVKNADSMFDQPFKQGGAKDTTEPEKTKAVENATAPKVPAKPGDKSPTVETTKKPEAKAQETDLQPLLAAISALTAEVQKMSSKLKTGTNGGIITTGG